MDSEIMVETLPLLGICNLCLNEGAVKSMLINHKHNENTELYVEMLLKCFSIDISSLELGDTKREICESCIDKLRDCLLFKEQVESSLKTLESTVKMNSVKKEEPMENDFYDIFSDVPMDCDEDDKETNESIEEDDEILPAPIKNEPSEDYNTRLRRKKNQSQRVSQKSLLTKSSNLSDTDTMLNSGLFPFKMRKNRMFYCAICPEKSADLDDIKSHVAEHKRTSIQIAFLKMIFSNSQRFYKVSTKLRCKMCTKDISDYAELKDHIESCTRIKLKSHKWSNLPFKLEKDQLDCPECKKKFLNFVSLNTHMNVHYPNYICESCGKAFASKARLRGHMRTHEVGNFPCKYCHAVFDRVTKRENHVSKDHKAGVRYACKRCNISLTSFYARQKHLAEVHNEELKRYKCQACPQSYITPGHLSSHVRRDHLNERNHKCDKCDLAFYTKNALKMHMIKHDGERIHVCHICQKSYQRKKTLREHMRIHNNDKRFVCPVCGRAFTQKCTLKGHLKVHDRKVDLDERIVQPLHSI